MISLTPLDAVILAGALLGALALLVALVASWRSKRRGGRTLALGAAFVALLIGTVALVAVVGPLAQTQTQTQTSTAPHLVAPVPAERGLYFGYDQGAAFDLVRVSARMGTVEWNHTTPLGAPAVATTSDGVVYGIDRQLRVWALRGSDGGELWHTQLVLPAGAVPTPDLAPLTPVIGDGEVYLTVSNLNNYRGALYALRTRDGKALWRHTLVNYYTTVRTEPLAAGDGLVIVPSLDTGISAFHALDGTLAWQSKYPGYYVKLFGDAVYVAYRPSDLIVALDARSGAYLWTLPCWQEDRVAFSGVGTQLYITGLPPEGAGPVSVYAFDTQQRRLLWKYAGTNPGAPPIATSDLVFIASGTRLDAVHARDGTQAWRQEAEEPNAGPTGLILIEDTLYVRVQLIYPHVYIFGCGHDCPKSYSLSAMRASDGALYWRQYELPGIAGWLASD